MHDILVTHAFMLAVDYLTHAAELELAGKGPGKSRGSVKSTGRQKVCDMGREGFTGSPE